MFKQLSHISRCVFSIQLLLVALYLSTACGAASVARPENVAGTYFISSINRRPLPAPISQDSFKTIETISGELRLATDGSFQSTSVIRETLVGAAPVVRDIQSAGTYTSSGNEVRLTNTLTQSTTRLTFSGDRLTYLSDLGNSYELQKVAIINR
ncbi:MAG: hypothetical protein LH467_16405 [Gemmatimonadaceae bacterium]|nr:hypothetical protein [Gemmatimonadaceae bacterium]